MRGYKKKMIFMSLSFAIVLLTMFATTFAWVGILTYANTNKLDINLKVLDYDADYFLVISSSGKVGTFSDTVDTIDLQRQVLKNKGKDVSMITSEDAINSLYMKEASNLQPVTTIPNSNNSLSDFKKMSMDQVNGTYNPSTGKVVPGFDSGEGYYLWFDLYFTVDTKEGISSMSEINAPIFLTSLEDAIVGTITSHTMLMYDTKTENDFREIDYDQYGELPYNNYVQVLKKAANSRKITIDSKNAIRFGFDIYEPIEIDKEYDETNLIKSNVIYSTGSTYPKYYEKDDVYDLGNNLPTIYNTAAQELMNTKTYFEINVPDEIINRGDLELTYDNNQIWKSATDLSKTSNYLGVHNGVQTKMRLRTYLWYEGWDADCILGIDRTSVELNLTFSAALD